MKEINFKDIELIVYGNYSPGEKGIMYDSDLAGVPDTESSFEITKITVTDSEIDIYDLFSAADLIIIIEELVINN